MPVIIKVFASACFNSLVITSPSFYYLVVIVNPCYFSFPDLARVASAYFYATLLAFCTLILLFPNIELSVANSPVML